MSQLKIIEYLLKYRPTSTWITAESGIPYLNVGIDVPWKDIFSEWEKIADHAVVHRSDDSYGNGKLINVGWKSLTLYGISSTNTVDGTGDMGWTDISKLCPDTVKWIEDNFVINEDTGRIRFMLLEPQGFIILHKDRDRKGLFEINVAITNPKECRFRFKNYGTVPFENGTAFLMDISNEHFVFNDSNEPRLHIIVHSKLKNQNLIVESYASRYYN